MTNEVFETNEEDNVIWAPVTISGVVNMECQEDQFEPNNTYEDAVSLMPGTYSDLSVCGGEDGGDFYLLCPPPGTTSRGCTRHQRAPRGV